MSPAQPCDWSEPRRSLRDEQLRALNTALSAEVLRHTKTLQLLTAETERHAQTRLELELLQSQTASGMLVVKHRPPAKKPRPPRFVFQTTSVPLPERPIRIGDLLIDCGEAEVHLGSAMVHLSVGQNRVMATVATHPGELRSSAQIAVLAGMGPTGSGNVREQLRRIRQKLATIGAADYLVQVVENGIPGSGGVGLVEPGTSWSRA